MSSSTDAPNPPRPATGKLGILTPGLGAVATTFMAGVESVRRGYSKPIGSLTQMATIRLGKRTEHRSPLIKDFVPLASLDDIVFGAWDPIPDDGYTAAKKAGVLSGEDLERVLRDLARDPLDPDDRSQRSSHHAIDRDEERDQDGRREAGVERSPGHPPIPSWCRRPGRPCGSA